MLGLVLNPSGINRTLNVGVRAQAARARAPFHRSPGIKPNDFQLARQYAWYTPVDHGWIVGRDHFYPQGNLGDASSAAAAAIMTTIDGPDETEALLRKLVQAEDLKSKMAVVSASAVVLMAILGVVSFVRSRGENF